VTDLPDGLRHVDCRTRDRPNAYLVDAGACTLVDDDAVTLVDAGWPGDEETVRAAFDAAGLVPSDVDRVLLTHYDVDHVGTLARLKPELDAPVYVHDADAPFVAGDRLPPWTGRTVFGPIHRLLYRRLTLRTAPSAPSPTGRTSAASAPSTRRGTRPDTRSTSTKASTRRSSATWRSASDRTCGPPTGSAVTTPERTVRASGHSSSGSTTSSTPAPATARRSTTGERAWRGQ